jgi:hypothetical protein
MAKKPVMFFVALVIVAACSGSSASPPSSPASVPVTVTASQPPSAAVETTGVIPSAASTPVTFTSQLYGYSITLPASWRVRAAILPWNGASAPGNDASTVDKFVSPATVSAFGFAGPVAADLDQFVKDNIAWTVRDHGDTCPATAPETTDPIQIGGEDGMLLSWNCGTLINQALVIRDGTAFVLVMRDPGVQAATDATDRALLEDLLNSVTLPS